MWQEYKDKNKSDVADIKNSAGREGGAITAAAFLEKYVGKIPWAHLDIAGTAWTTEERAYLAKGATGFGVRLLLEALTQWDAQASTPDTPATPGLKKSRRGKSA